MRKLATSSTSPDMTAVFHTWPYDRYICMVDTEQSQEKETSQNETSSNFLGGSFSNRECKSTPAS